MPTVGVTSFEPVPEGTYRLRLNDCQIRENRENKNQFLGWTLEVISEGETFGRTFGYNTPMKVNKKSKLEKLLNACGAPELAVGDNIDTDDYIGQEFVAKVVIVPMKNQTGVKNDLEAIWSLDEFDALLAQAASVRKPTTAAKPAATATPAAKPVQQPTAVPQRPAATTPATPPQRPVGTTVKPQRPAAQQPVQQPPTAAEGVVQPGGDLEFPTQT